MAPDRSTIDVYEQQAEAWQAVREAQHTDAAVTLGRRVAASGLTGPVVDLGCGPGWHAPALSEPRGGSGHGIVSLDAARAMLELVPDHAPDALRVRADLAALPFARGTLAGAWASRCYVHLARRDLPMALADLHRALVVGAPFELHAFTGDLEHGPLGDDRFAGRMFSLWPETLLLDVVTGAGFTVDDLTVETGRDPIGLVVVRGVRARTLADTVGADMRLLVCGLNPSVYSADAGVPFARPGNRFWPAALAAGLVSIDRDPVAALREHGMGMTDLVKRATPRADGLTRAEYRAGVERLERLAAWLRPGAICFVGLAGWRSAVDRAAVAGPQPERLGGAPVYVMPSTSGVNARVPPSELSAHLRAAADLAG